MPDFYLKQDDLLPSLEAVLSGVSSLTGAAVVFVFKNVTTGTVVRRNATITDAITKTVRVDWITGDTSATGEFQCEFEVTIGSKTLTFPNDKNLTFRIVADIR